MQPIETRKFLTHKAVLVMLSAAIDRAEAMGQPQCIVIVDASGGTLAELKMTGAKFLSLKSARAKALTAASTGKPSSAIPEPVRPAIAAATGGAVTGLPGGLPVMVDGELVGGIGIGSGSGDQDVDVANAALAKIGATQW
ncbi:MAG: heme-binding protein [Hoeflea sp.]|uniref:GlcG/HbpS family heme-binding protein n=1 Tax=Hoeflea sp. TaxID=1940281 RepID=UPI00273078F8|nr:heme-binding protein [Hoeflea sp.]MDP2119536.1 heme-binding protein [Hoeflea sp.]MDP3523831.1 heme-binding protein [Hoeflea sp.]MDZ7603072.1 heme-binding protein [Hoeflea sp.]